VFQLASSDHRPLHFGRTGELTGLGFRRWVRKGGGDAGDRLLNRHLDPVPVAEDGQGWLTPDRTRRWADRLRRALGDLDRDALPGWLDELAGEELQAWRKRTERRLGETTLTLIRVEQMLELFRPFIHDNDWVFETSRSRSVGDGALRFDLEDLDWRRYWVDVEYPGLRTWCIPVLLGDTVAWDAPSSPPLRLIGQADAERAASK
jgi:long-chain acyl-CoA synthetase